MDKIRGEVTYEFRGKEYPLLFDLGAMEAIEDEFGSMKKCLEELHHGKQFKTLRILFRILVNAAREARGEEQDATGDEIRTAGIAEMGKLNDAISGAMALGKRTETEPGQAGSDERRDLYEDEEDVKNGRTGGSRES